MRKRPGLVRNACRGLTLIELCFGLCIVAILAGLSMPSLQSALGAAAIRSATFELAAGIRQARASSIVEALPVVLCPSDHAGNCLRGGSAPAWRATLQSGGHEALLSRRTLPAGIVLFTTRPALTFWPHALSASTVTLTICDVHGRARPRSIVISQSGRARFASAAPERCRK